MATYQHKDMKSGNPRTENTSQTANIHNPIPIKGHPRSLWPFLGLRAKLSQAFASYAVVFLLVSAFQLYRTRNTIEKFTADAKASVAQECYALEQSLSSVALLPNLAAQGVNRGLVLAVEASISQIGYGLAVVLSGLLSTLELIMGLLTGTWRCFLGNLADSGIPFLSDVGTEGVEAIDELNGAVLNLLAIPFNGLGELIEAKMAAPQIGNLIAVSTVVAPKVEFCERALSLAPIDRLATDFRLWILYGTITLLGAALVITLANMAMIWYHHRRWMAHVGRVQPELSAITMESPGRIRGLTPLMEKPKAAIDKHDPERAKLEKIRIFHMVQHPLVHQFMDWSSNLLFKTDTIKRNIYLWFIRYVSHPPAVVCLLIGLLGLALTFGQIAFIEYMRRNYQAILAPAITDLSAMIFNSIQDSMQAASLAFSTEVNAALSVVEAELNYTVFAEIVRAAGELNSALVKVQTTLVEGVRTIFGASIFAKLVGAVLQCLLFNKLEIVGRGLGWVRENAQISLPRVMDDILMMDKTQLDAIVASSVSSLMGISLWADSPQPNSTSGWSGAQRIEGSISKVFTQYEDSLRRELPVYYSLVAVWVVILLLGLIGTFARVILL
ncbi:plasma membrane fusion protein prm1 [Linnemannia zychae]|nr:plasma membrane fusion protein prm1 [Linnemannia zychae]